MAWPLRDRPQLSLKRASRRPLSRQSAPAVSAVEWPSEEEAKTTDGFAVLRKVIPFAIWLQEVLNRFATFFAILVLCPAWQDEVTAKLPAELRKLKLAKASSVALNEHEPLDVGLEGGKDAQRASKIDVVFRISPIGWI